MASVARLTRTGGPEVLSVEIVDRLNPAEGQVWIEQEAIGVNYLDVMQRKGASPLALPSGLGLEGAGVVAAVGPGVSSVAVGDRVAYAGGQIGSYSSGRLYPAERLVRLPDSLDFDTAASLLFKGITAQYLLKSTYKVTQGTTILLYGAAGGVAQLMVPWAKNLGAFVIGVVRRKADVERARELGCDAVLVSGSADLAAEVASLTDGRKADVVYDGVGRATFEASLNSLRPRGLMVSIGASSGPPPAVELSTLNAKGSLFLTRPSFLTHTADPAEYRERAADVLAAAADGIIKPEAVKTFQLRDVRDAHAALEAGGVAGAIVLKP